MNMKLNNSIVIVAAALLSLTSCLKDQTDVFETPSSQRMQDYLANVRSLLTDSSNKNGWVLSYYPGKDYATCYMGVVFEAQKVTAYSQDAPETGVTSSYKLTEDDGPVLSFDTYNSVLHYYATSDASHYQARGGDFEFEIKSVEEDRIVLRGKRSGNYCYLDKLSKSVPDFLKEAVAAEAALNIVSFTGEVTGGLVDGFLDGTSHTFSIGRKDADATEMVSARYMVTTFGEDENKKVGIHFNEPFTFQGVTFEDFVYEEDAENPTIGTLSGSGIAFTKVVPEGYVAYNQFVGTYKLKYANGSFDVTLVPYESGSSFKLKGFCDKFEPIITYNGARGYLSWIVQEVGSAGSNVIKLCPLDSDAGYLGWAEGIGMNGRAVDNTVKEIVVEWEDNGIWGSYNATGWILWSFDASGSSAGQYSDWALASGKEYIMGPMTMTKIVEE